MKSRLVPDPASGRLAGQPLEAWNEAYCRVDAYFSALGVRNHLLRGQLVLQVLGRAAELAAANPGMSPTDMAAREMNAVLDSWFARVLGREPGQLDPTLSVKGRMALLLADMPGRWQQLLLHPGPWPDEFIRAVRDSFLRAGPEFQVSQMTPVPLDLGPMATLAEISRLPYARLLLLWVVFALVLVLVFWLTH